MKFIKITIIILIAATALNYIRADRAYNIIRALPFCDGEPINNYHWGALAILIITLWGYHRLTRKK